MVTIALGERQLKDRYPVSQQGKQRLRDRSTMPSDSRTRTMYLTSRSLAQGRHPRPWRENPVPHWEGKRSEFILDTSCCQMMMAMNCYKSNLTSNQLIKMSWMLKFPHQSCTSLHIFGRERKKWKSRTSSMLLLNHGAKSLPMLTPLTRISQTGHISQHPELPKGLGVWDPTVQVSSGTQRLTLCREMAV